MSRVIALDTIALWQFGKVTKIHFAFVTGLAFFCQNGVMGARTSEECVDPLCLSSRDKQKIQHLFSLTIPSRDTLSLEFRVPERRRD